MVRPTVNDAHEGGDEHVARAMAPVPPPGALYEHSFEVHGVRMAVSASDPEVLSRMVGLLPGGVKPSSPDKVQRRFSVWKEDESGWRYDSGSGASPVITDLTLAIGIVDLQLRLHVASTAPERIFVHAGAVAFRGRALVLPGYSFSGKSTLVAALVRAGAVYYSDEYAILDRRGLVHPYTKPLSIREPDSHVTDSHWAAVRPVESIGGTAGEEPVPVGLIAATKYRPQSSWRPELCSAGHGMLALLANAVPARERPADALTAVRRAAANAVVLEGERGEADEAAQALLEIAHESFPNGDGPHP